jgi:orotate phosphoribosyltransferase-like protein
MHDENIVQRFIELRAQGWTYARLMTALNVSKPTLTSTASEIPAAEYHDQVQDWQG